MSAKILIADDSASIRKMLGIVLRGAGYLVSENEDGREALNNAAVFLPDLVITDLNMPVMDGVALITELRTKPFGKCIPIIMLTTESQQEKKNLGRAAGATGWIVKPFHPDKLLAVLRQLLRETGRKPATA